MEQTRGYRVAGQLNGEAPPFDDRGVIGVVGTASEWPDWEHEVAMDIVFVVACRATSFFSSTVHWVERMNCNGSVDDVFESAFPPWKRV